MAFMEKSSLMIASGISASDTLARTKFTGELPPAGTINSLELDFSSVSSAGVTVVKLTLGWINADRRYIVNSEGVASALALEYDASDATKASYELSINKEYNGIPDDATGIWIGIDLNAGKTATVAAYLHIRGHS
jgi:hypothetical protein